jgi:hypothetical protein
LDFSAIWVNDAFDYRQSEAETAKKISRNTIGTNLGLNKREIPFSFYATAYHQFGRDTENKRLDTWLLALNTAYRLSGNWSLAAGVDYFSGTSSGESLEGKNKTFNKLYGSNHSFNGSMEYWTRLPSQGLLDVYGSLLFKPFAGFDATLSFHSFALPEALPETNDRNIGSEIDLTLNYAFSPQLSLQGGWSTYFANRQTAILKEQTGISTQFPHWAYLMITFKPTFVKK